MLTFNNNDAVLATSNVEDGIAFISYDPRSSIDLSIMVSNAPAPQTNQDTIGWWVWLIIVIIVLIIVAVALYFVRRQLFAKKHVLGDQIGIIDGKYFALEENNDYKVGLSGNTHMQPDYKMGFH